MTEPNNDQSDALLAIADSLDKLTATIAGMRPTEPTADSPLRITVNNVAPAAGWRVLIGELVGNEIVFSHLPLMAWVTKTVRALGGDDIYISPVVWDAEHQHGVELAVYLEARRCESPGITSRLLAPNQEYLTADETAAFEREIRVTFRDERIESNKLIEARNARIHAPLPRRSNELSN